MTAVVADTHTTIWYLRESSRLSESALTALDTATQAKNYLVIMDKSLRNTLRTF
jgi:PIN domain nuclease of toxin-antitoxin system